MTNHSCYYLAKQAAKGAIPSAYVVARLKKSDARAATKAKNKSARGDLAGKRQAARAERIARQRVDEFGKATLFYTREVLNIRRGVGPGRGDHLYDLSCGGNPLLLCACLMADIGRSIVRDVRTLADPTCREEMKRRFARDLRQLRRPFYYARETERRRELAQQRRTVMRRRTSAPKPTPEAIKAAWDARKSSKEAMIRLGGMLIDLSCYVDSSLRYDEFGNVVGRNGGIRGWLAECLPELLCKYKTLMRYKEMAEKLRQATGACDPMPTAELLNPPPHQIIAEILADNRNTFAAILRALAPYLNPERVLMPPTGRRSADGP